VAGGTALIDQGSCKLWLLLFHDRSVDNIMVGVTYFDCGVFNEVGSGKEIIDKFASVINE